MVDDEVFADAPHFAGPTENHYWLRTPYGNLLYATGPEQLGALLAMIGAIEFELNVELRTLLNSIFRFDIDGRTIEIEFDAVFRAGSVSDQNGQLLGRFWPAPMRWSGFSLNA
ncbi:hypothetical protein C7I85_14880 [Mesorhizobium soli]|uniref:Uncharacterized protein n=1 Tax=Pseudaminobacter soli (ex Li et al. 2025) TaxID=1295366 RepID=A0A2P7SD48_9HYPH|nr:hypothetical protein C7I85_14880 [Mesorhizobium soli]